MSKTLAEVMAAADDRDLCEGIYNLMVLRYGRNCDPGILNPEQRTVYLVWRAHQRIMRGGFRELWQHEVPGDPTYAQVRAAFEELGAEAIREAVIRAFQAFPDQTPPTNPAERVRTFDAVNLSLEGALNRDYQNAARELSRILARYIRDRSAAFAGIDKPGDAYAVAASGPTPSAAPAAAPTEADAVQTGVKRLPHWARAAFFAHAARLVCDLWTLAWPDGPPGWRDQIEQAVFTAEMCAGDGQSSGDLKALSAEVVRIAQLAYEGAQPPPRDPATIVNIALAAASALDYITGDTEAEAYEFARGAAQAASRIDLLEQFRQALARLKRLAKDGGWTDRTPVPPEVFRPDFEVRSSPGGRRR